MDPLVSETIVETEVLLRLLVEGEQLGTTAEGYDKHLESVVACCDFIRVADQGPPHGGEYGETHRLLQHKLLLNALMRHYGYEGELYNSDTSLRIGPRDYLTTIVCLQLQDYCLDALGECPRAIIGHVAFDLLGVTLQKILPNKTPADTTHINTWETGSQPPAASLRCLRSSRTYEVNSTLKSEGTTRRNELHESIQAVQDSVARRCLSSSLGNCISLTSGPERIALDLLASKEQVLYRLSRSHLDAERYKLHTCLVWLDRMLIRMQTDGSGSYTDEQARNTMIGCRSPDATSGATEVVTQVTTCAEMEGIGRIATPVGQACSECVGALHSAIHIVEKILWRWNRSYESRENVDQKSGLENEDNLSCTLGTYRVCTLDVFRMDVELALSTVSDLIESVHQSFANLARTAAPNMQPAQVPVPAQSTSSYAPGHTLGDNQCNKGDVQGNITTEKGGVDITLFQNALTAYGELRRLIDSKNAFSELDLSDEAESEQFKKRRRSSSSIETAGVNASDGVGEKKACALKESDSVDRLGTLGDVTMDTTHTAQSLCVKEAPHECASLCGTPCGTENGDEDSRLKRAKVMKAGAGLGVPDLISERLSENSKMESHSAIKGGMDSQAHLSDSNTGVLQTKEGYVSVSGETPTSTRMHERPLSGNEEAELCERGFAAVEKLAQHIVDEQDDYIVWLDQLLALPREVRSHVTSLLGDQSAGLKLEARDPLMSKAPTGPKFSLRTSVHALESSLSDPYDYRGQATQSDTLPAVLWARVFCSTEGDVKHKSSTTQDTDQPSHDNVELGDEDIPSPESSPDEAEDLWQSILSSCEAQITSAPIAWRERQLTRLADMFVWVCLTPSPVQSSGRQVPGDHECPRCTEDSKFTDNTGEETIRQAESARLAVDGQWRGVESKEVINLENDRSKVNTNKMGIGGAGQASTRRVCAKHSRDGRRESHRVTFRAADGLRERLRDTLVAGILSMPRSTFTYALRGWLFNTVWCHLFESSKSWYTAADEGGQNTKYTRDAYNLYDIMICETHTHTSSSSDDNVGTKHDTGASDPLGASFTPAKSDANGSDEISDECRMKLELADDQDSFTHVLTVCLNQLIAGICLTSSTTTSRPIAESTVSAAEKPAHTTASGTKLGTNYSVTKPVSEEVSTATDTLLTLSLFGPGQVLSGLLRMALQNRTQSGVLVDVILEGLRLHTLTVQHGVPLILKVMQEAILNQFVNHSGPSAACYLDTGVNTIRRIASAVGVLTQVLFDRRILPAANFTTIVQYFVLPYLYADAGLVFVIALRLLDDSLNPQTYIQVRGHTATTISVLYSVVLSLCELLEQRHVLCRVLVALGSSLDTVTRCLVRALKTLGRLWGEQPNRSIQLPSVESTSEHNACIDTEGHAHAPVIAQGGGVCAERYRQPESGGTHSRKRRCAEVEPIRGALWLRSQIAKFDWTTRYITDHWLSEYTELDMASNYSQFGRLKHIKDMNVPFWEYIRTISGPTSMLKEELRFEGKASQAEIPHITHGLVKIGVHSTQREWDGLVAVCRKIMENRVLTQTLITVLVLSGDKCAIPEANHICRLIIHTLTLTVERLEADLNSQGKTTVRTQAPDSQYETHRLGSPLVPTPTADKYENHAPKTPGEGGQIETTEVAMDSTERTDTVPQPILAELVYLVGAVCFVLRNLTSPTSLDLIFRFALKLLKTTLQYIREETPRSLRHEPRRNRVNSHSQVHVPSPESSAHVTYFDRMREAIATVADRQHCVVLNGLLKRHISGGSQAIAKQGRFRKGKGKRKSQTMRS